VNRASQKENDVRGCGRMLQRPNETIEHLAAVFEHAALAMKDGM
jgi:hypothetical protein